jgi:hypothetical protein
MTFAREKWIRSVPKSFRNCVCAAEAICIIVVIGFVRGSRTCGSAGGACQKAGSIWAGGTWDVGISGSGDVKTQLNTGGKNGGTYLGMSDYVYNFDSAFGQHAFIELCIPNYATLLGSDLAGATIRWSPVCGNDQLSLCVVLSSGQGPRPGPVPEPTSVMIWAVVFLAAARFARRSFRPLASYR